MSTVSADGLPASDILDLALAARRDGAVFMAIWAYGRPVVHTPIAGRVLSVVSTPGWEGVVLDDDPSAPVHVSALSNVRIVP